MMCLGLLNIQEHWNAPTYHYAFPIFHETGVRLSHASHLCQHKSKVLLKVQLNSTSAVEESLLGNRWSIKAHAGAVLLMTQLDSAYAFLSIDFTQMLSITKRDAFLTEMHPEYSRKTKERGKLQYFISCRHHLVWKREDPSLFLFPVGSGKLQAASTVGASCH